MYKTACAPLSDKDSRYNDWLVTPALSYKCIAFDKEDEGKTYFDVALNEDNTYSLVLHNRDDDQERMKSLALRMGIPENSYLSRISVIDGMNKFVYKNSIPASEVHGEINSLIERLKTAGV